ncbi:MAG: NAD(P) transhydrogenase subunit alpha [Alphaproteobacteria bacterium]|nr:NAD(P) transhydrogenase subunit alpha [Alphaproteobacteria bacterium]
MSNAETLIDQSSERVAEELENLRASLEALQNEHVQTMVQGVDPFIAGLTVFVLACFVGYYVVWKVTPALHTPLMAVTNAISGIIVVGAIIAVGPEGMGFSQMLGFVAVVIASINIFGGFIVTQRMLQMFRKRG